MGSWPGKQRVRVTEKEGMLSVIWVGEKMKVRECWMTDVVCNGE
jgi:hypothetical protein